MAEPALNGITDGVVTLCVPRPGDAKRLVEGREEEFFRWLGPGAETPNPALIARRLGFEERGEIEKGLLFVRKT